MRKHLIWIVVLIIALSACGIKKTYSPAQSERNIVKIEIIDVYSWHEYVAGGTYEHDVVCEIPKKNYDLFFKDLWDIPCKSYYGSPYNGFAEDTIRITYSDGAFELVGEKSVYYETLDGKWTYPSYDFESEAYYNFLSAWEAI